MNIKLTNSALMALSEMVDAMGISKEMTKIEGKTNEEVGKELIGLFFTKLYKAKKQYYNFIIEFKEINIEDKNLTEEEIYNKKIEIAANMDVIELFKELFQIEGISDFLSLT